MPFTAEYVDEMNTLVYFDINNSQEGIKIHSNASPAIVAAARRLYSKGLISQPDGGYLTLLGRDAAEHAQVLLQILSSSPEVIHP